MPPGPPAASMVFLDAHSRPGARISRAGMRLSASAHSGVWESRRSCEHVVFPLVKASGARGTWHAKQTDGDYLWKLTFTAPGISPPLWFGVKTRMSCVYTNDLSPIVVDRMV
jgi:hypothetical protein